MSLTVSFEEQGILLADARESITSRLEGRQPQFRSGSAAKYSALYKPCGAFVSLYKLDAPGGSPGRRSLRGCIGRMTASLPLAETVCAMAREAAFADPRFPPLKPGELGQCLIEISAISPMSACPDPRQVKVGVHGLYLVKGGRAGVLLPQVPLEQGWNLDEYLDYICIKAGLPALSYNAPDASLYTFTAAVFGE